MDERSEEQGRRSTKKWWLLGGATAALAVGLYLAFGFFGVQTLFVDDVVEEAGPVFDSGASASGAPATEPADGGQGSNDVGTPSQDPDAGDAAVDHGGDEPTIITLASGQFSGVGRYDGTGTANVLTDGSDQRFVRFEDDFATDNGPDLLVYLGTGTGNYEDPSQYVELGVLTGNIGAQNYEIPAVHPETGEPIDLAVFDHVAVWCKRFDATFTVAALS
ncbi:MAG: DM13 domain-containing protein [Acidimicrobiia bacterium]|nr:DM13 domain-containing protein [Acidimicrobiia bacterium]